jgi:two-component system C4-dicarboxylate transport sensor histidine kinase DctB
VSFDPASGEFIGVAVRAEAARDAVVRLYILVTLTLLAVYGLIAASLEIFVLPQHVYGPIRAMLRADRAVQEGRGEELIPAADMPADELGEIMRSRNEAILTIRRHERALAEALAKLEAVATDLKRKNHLIEMARRNMAEHDRLASLGMMSAGLAHEMNTPLAVLKGLTEKLDDGGGAGVSKEEAELMRRVVDRLERLSESLLDFARVRPPASAPTPIRAVVQEAWTLVRLDRERDVEVVNAIPDSLIVPCDADRMVQVFVNLLRNSVDAVSEQAAPHRADHGHPGEGEGRIEVAAERTQRDGHEFISITITDNGPGIHADMLATLFEPFTSTRLDSRGTGLGLAVSEGIVREHGGVLLARNRADAGGAVFEIVLPMEPAHLATEDTQMNTDGKTA